MNIAAPIAVYPRASIPMITTTNQPTARRQATARAGSQPQASQRDAQGAPTARGNYVAKNRVSRHKSSRQNSGGANHQRRQGMRGSPMKTHHDDTTNTTRGRGISTTDDADHPDGSGLHCLSSFIRVICEIRGSLSSPSCRPGSPPIHNPKSEIQNASHPPTPQRLTRSL